MNHSHSATVQYDPIGEVEAALRAAGIVRSKVTIVLTGLSLRRIAISMFSLGSGLADCRSRPGRWSNPCGGTPQLRVRRRPS